MTVTVDDAVLAAAADPEAAAARAADLLATLPPMEVAARAAQVRERLDAAGCDALVVTKLVNIRWLTGFTGSAALVVVLPDRLVFTTDGRYGEQSEHQLADAGVEAERTVAGGDGQRVAIIEALASSRRVGLEADDVTWAQQRRWDDEWFPASTLVPTSMLVDELRITKDAGEVARIEAACAVADAALARVRHRLAEGPTTLKTPLSTPKTVQPMLSGSGGLSSTTEDYFRFVEMLRNRGEYRGVRLIKPETLDAMLVDQIGANVDRTNWFYGPVAGFGLGFGLLPIDFADPSKGTVFSWSGYAGTNMWVDPQNDITTIFMIQTNEAPPEYAQKMRQWVYSGYKEPTAATAPAPAAPH